MNLRIETWWDLTEIAECIKKTKEIYDTTEYISV